MFNHRTGDKMRLYSMPSSGNSYKIRLLAALTGTQLDLIDCEHNSAALAQAKADGILPFGKVPVLVLDDGRKLAESGAILWYLGEGSDYIPSDAVLRAQVLGWMFWEQYNHEPVIAVRQALLCYPDRAADAAPERMADLLERGHALLQVMEEHLAANDWLVSNPSLADLSLYAYTHTAGRRGGFDMARFPAIGKWLGRIEALPRYQEL